MATFVVGRLGLIEEVDDEACTLLGFLCEELLRMHGSQLVPDADRVRVGLSVDQVRRGEAEFRRGRLIHKDGTILQVDIHARALPGKRVALIVRPSGA